MTEHVFVYTTCLPKVAESLVDGTFFFPGLIEFYYDVEDALKMAHPGDKWLVALRIPKLNGDFQSKVRNFTHGGVSKYLYSVTRLDKFREELNMVTSVDKYEVKPENNIHDNAFTCPKCHNKTLVPVEKPGIVGIDYHDLCICEECGAELLAEPQFDFTVKFVEPEEE